MPEPDPTHGRHSRDYLSRREGIFWGPSQIAAWSTPPPRHHQVQPFGEKAANLAGRAVGATGRAAAAAVGGVTRFVTPEVVSSVAPGRVRSHVIDQESVQDAGEAGLENRGPESSVYALERHRIDPAGDARRHARAGRHPRRIIVAGTAGAALLNLAKRSMMART
jgi:hypothetical protein